jgi:hypothetical protein
MADDKLSNFTTRVSALSGAERFEILQGALTKYGLSDDLKAFIFNATDEAKVDNISITQPVDLDALETRVNELDASVILQGTWDASAGTFPGSGTAQAGHSYIVSVAGTVDSVAFAVDDRIIAILDNASTTVFASNWHKADYTDQVLSVAGRTGAVTLTTADIPNLSGTNTGDEVAASTTVAGKTEYATAAEFRSKTANLSLTPALAYSAAAEVTLTDATTITVDFDTFINGIVTLAGNRTLGNPTNTDVGQSGYIRVVQDGTGSRTLAFGTSYEFAGGTAPTLTTTAAADDILFYTVISATRILISSVLDIS